LLKLLLQEAPSLACELLRNLKSERAPLNWAGPYCVRRAAAL
jgi:hypothetical protein